MHQCLQSSLCVLIVLYAYKQSEIAGSIVSYFKCSFDFSYVWSAASSMFRLTHSLPQCYLTLLKLTWAWGNAAYLLTGLSMSVTGDHSDLSAALAVKHVDHAESEDSPFQWLGHPDGDFQFGTSQHQDNHWPICAATFIVGNIVWMHLSLSFKI